MKGRALLGGMIALCAGLIAFLFVQFQDGGRAGVGVRRAAACTDPAPACLPQLTFLDIAGAAMPPEALAGKVVVVNFWATWCEPCRREIPDLAATYDRYRDQGVVMLGVLADAPSDAALDAFVEQAGITYPVVRSDPEMMRQFEHPEALPTTFVYDKRGHARWVRPGQITSRQLEDVLDTLVAE